MKKLLFLLGFASIVGLVVVLIIFAVVDIPSIESFSEREVVESTKIYDSSGEVLLWEIHGEEKRTVVALEDISRHAKNATIAVEDRSFYSHRGISVLAIMRAFFVDILEGKKSQGGSTITQQLIKNALLTPERTIERKIKEVVMALKLEGLYSKDEILNLYLNEIPYGSNAYGIEAASQTFFEKSSRDLSLAEAAYLASLPKAPSYYSPYRAHRDELEKRKDLALAQMLALEFITQDDYENAKTEKVVFADRADIGIRAPHFVMYVRDLLSQRFGDQYIEREGLTVITSLNAELQKKAEEVVATYAKENTEKFNAANAALVALDPKTGNILAMVGSKSWFGEPYPEGCSAGIDCLFDPKLNIVTNYPGRQPGSAIKPIVYATALKKGYTPDTVVFDLKTEFTSKAALEAGLESYAPENYDEKFRGPVTFREALAQSINVPSVKVLYLAGLTETLAAAKDLGITTLTDPLRYGLTLVLGGGETPLLELASAYGVFANEGIRTSPNAIIEVKSSKGTVLFSHEPKKRQVIEPEIARLISDILADNEAREPAFGNRSPLFFEGYDVAAKTGTTSNYRDAWTLGYSPGIVVGAWAGNNNNSPMEKKIAGFIVAPMWHEFMTFALSKIPEEKFTKPEIERDIAKPVLKGEWRGSKTYTIDTVSGKLATVLTPEISKKEEVIKEIHSILHWVYKDDPRGQIPEYPARDPQYENWEAPVRQWVLENNIQEENSSIIPKEFDDVHTEETIPRLTLKEPLKSSYNSGDILIIKPRLTSKYPIAQIDAFLNNEFIKSERGAPAEILINLSSLDITPGISKLVLKIYDTVGNKNEAEFLIAIDN